jgi:2-octaprenyl-6-methoxyphenol hydroxylase
MPATEVDVSIRGAGPVGCALGAALRDSNLKVAVVDRGSPNPPFRPIALSYASRLILERLGVWRELAVTPIDTIHVSERGAFGQARLDAADAGVPSLGYVTDYASLARALRGSVADLISPDETPARCVVHAEGASAGASEKRYAQDAVVGIVEVSPPASQVAFERFTGDGPLALLPFSGRYALVWSAKPERAAALAAAPEAEFLSALAAAAGSRPGRPLACAARAVQPLALRVNPARVGDREVFIGNAAQTLHPVAGQGLNLGLRDAWELAQSLRHAPDPGDAAILTRYATQRRLDAGATIRVTDFLASAFLGSPGPMHAVRGAARGAFLMALDVFPPARRFFARRMIYGASALP